MSYYNSTLQSHMDRLWDLVIRYGLDPTMSLKYISCLLDIKHLDWKRKREGGNLGRNRLWEEMAIHGVDYFLSIRDEDLLVLPRTIETSRLTPDLLVESMAIIGYIYDEIEIRYSEGDCSPEVLEGFLYEQLLSRTVLLGNRGQFRTPRHIVQLMVELIQPQKEDVIVDPVCGTGGFLLSACEYITRERLRKENSANIEKDLDGFDSIGTDCRLDWNRWRFPVIGWDNDETMVMLARMNFRMHGIEEVGITQKDSLDRGLELERKADVVLANPPFGIRIRNRETGRVEASEMLFLKYIFEQLRSGGRAAVVVPEGVVFNNDKVYRELRKVLVEQMHLMAVISLHAGAFQPYTQGKSTVLIFVNECVGSGLYPVWFYELESDGYSLDINRQRLKDFPLVELVDFYNRGRVNPENNRSFFVSSEDIRSNRYDLSYNLYKPDQYIKQDIVEPQEILRQLMNLEEEVYQEMKELNSYFRARWNL